MGSPARAIAQTVTCRSIRVRATRVRGATLGNGGAQAVDGSHYVQLLLHPVSKLSPRTGNGDDGDAKAWSSHFD